MTKRRKETITFKKEADLCASFAESAKEQGFKVFPETSNWDLLLVAEKELVISKYVVCAKGDTIGVQAKLRPSLELLSQTIPRWADTGPDFILMAVPHASPAFHHVAQCLHLNVVTPENRFSRLCKDGSLEFSSKVWWNIRPVHRHYFAKPPWYPDIDVEHMPAGVPSPRSLTQWKVKAIQLCLHAEKAGFITIEDFARFGVSPHRWIQGGWIEALPGEGKRKQRKYVLSKSDDLPHRRYANVTEAIQKRAEEAKREED